MPGDLWNNYSYMFWGSLIFAATSNMWLAMAVMFLLVLYNLIFVEMYSKRWATYYGYTNCVPPALHIAPSTPFAIGGNWVLNKLGANKIRWSPADLQERLGFPGRADYFGLDPWVSCWAFWDTSAISGHWPPGATFCLLPFLLPL